MKKNYSSAFKNLVVIAGKLFVFAFLAVVMFFPLTTNAAWTYTLSSPANPTVPAADVCPGQVAVPIYSVIITRSGSGTGTATMTGLSFTTNPGYVATSVTQFRLWRNTVNSLTGAVPMSTINPAGGPGVQTFPAFGSYPLSTSPQYFLITMDVAVAPTTGNTITVAPMTWSNFTISGGTLSTCTGCTNSGGTQTIIGITSQPSTSGSVCVGSPVTVNIGTSSGPSWTYQWQYFNGSSWNNVAPGVPVGASYGATATTASLGINGLAAGNYPYRCIVGGACGATSNSVTVIVQPMQTYTPQLNAWVNHGSGFYVTPADPDNITICFRTMIDFDKDPFPTVPIGGTNDWYVNNSLVQACPPVIYSNNTLNDQDSVYIKFTYSGTGCYNSPSYSNKLYFTVYPSDPPDAISATASAGPYCIGQNITFNAIVGGQLGSSPIYKWLDNGVPIVGANALSYTGTFSAGNHPIQFVVQSSDTCSSPSTDTLSLGNIAVGLCYDTMPTTGWSSINRCGGLFYDSGGPTNPYVNGNNASLLTIYPTTPGQYVTVTFTSFSSELNVDKLRIFSGTDTSTFLGQLTGTGSACGTFTSAHSSGALTFKWITNAIIQGPGWAANLGCSSTPAVVTPGLNCANPININTLPYAVAGQNNTCFSNNHVSGMSCSTTNVGGNDMFYRYVATAPECITVFLNNTSNNSVSLNVYQGCPGAGGICQAFWTTAVAGTLGGQVTLPAAGVYYIVVDANTSVNFTYNLSINSFGSAPLNDLPCSAEVLTQTIPHFDDNSCASTETGGGVNNSSCVSGNLNTLWYSFTTNPGQTSARVRFTRGLGTLPDLNAQAYSGTCSALNYISCATFGMNGFWDCTAQPQLQFATLPSTTYYIRVDGQGNSTGSYQITVDNPAAIVPAYGYDCGNPISISAQTCTYGTPAFIGVGDQCDFPTSNSAGFAGERDGVYFLFQTIAGQNGANQLTFDIYSDPSVTTDWDFIIWNVTSQYNSGGQPAVCSYLSGGVWNTAAGMISSSWVDTWQAPANGHTGCRSTGTTHINGFPFNAPIPLSGTQWWMLYISNFRLNLFPYGFTLEMGYSNSSTTSNYNPQNAGAVVYNTTSPPQMIWWTGQGGTTNWFTMANWGGCAVPSCVNNTSATISSFYSPLNPFFPSIGSSGAVTKNLTIRPTGSLTIAPAGQLDICGNYLNIGTFTAQSGSTVRATSDQFQYFDGSMSGSSAFSNLVMTKSVSPLRPVTLFNKAEVTGALTLTTGKIVTNAKELYISNTTPTQFFAPNGNTNSYVQGNLRRAISGSGGSYDFPVGIATSYQRANVNFTTATTIPTLLSYFTGTSIPIQPGPIGPECVAYDYSSLAPLNNGYWTVQASNNPTSGNYNMTLYNTAFSNSGGAVAWTVLKATTSAGPWSLSGNCAGVSSAIATSRDNMNGFSVFTSGQAGTPVLPVEILTLTATLANAGVDVTWETATEINNDYFDIERSQDGIHFEKIGWKQGAGNSTITLYYSLFDSNPYSGINYYRLKQVDKDGTYEYSDKVYVVVNPDAGLISVYPNPAQSNLWCDLYTEASGALQFEIMDVLGKTYSMEVRDANKGLNEKVEFNINYLPQGVYFIRVKALDSSNIMPVSQMRFVKQAREE